MATYAIGDVQGCFLTFQKLLERIAWDPARDRLWLAGDLVNRGPRSLEVLRWCFDHQSHVVTVLGNHDLHLLARGAKLSEPRKQDTIEPILMAGDREVLLHWLRSRPFLHREGSWLLAHAGVLPNWGSVEETERRARQLEGVLRGVRWTELLEKRTSPSPSSEIETARQALGVFTRMRMIGKDDGLPAYDYDGPPENAPKDLIPWFEALGGRLAPHKVLFGHWAALGHRVMQNAIGLDSGCVWKNSLTAVRLDDSHVFQERYADG